MPCYLFTWHAYATWMPDRQRGYVKRGRGVLPTDQEEAVRYRERQNEDSAAFDFAAQQLVLDEAAVAAKWRRFRLHAVATDPTHMHVLVSWADERDFEELRRGLRESITRRLNSHIRRKWLAHGGSRKRVTDRRHFEYLMNAYLPKHRGWKWCEGVGAYR